MRRSARLSAQHDQLSAATSAVSKAGVASHTPNTTRRSMPSKGKVALTPFPRPIPDDILLYVCEVLDGMKESAPGKRPCAGDKIAQRTLLNIQLTSKAGWRAVTPLIWRTLKFVREDDYMSFLSPFTRLAVETAWMGKVEKRSHLSALASLHSTSRQAAIDRFYQSTGWVRAIFNDSCPPMLIPDELDLLHSLGKAMTGEVREYLSKGIALFLGGDALGHAAEGEAIPRTPQKFLKTWSVALDDPRFPT